MTTTLISTSDLRVDLHRNGSRSVICTFTERTFRDLDKPGFGTGYLLAQGFDVVAIKTNRDIWYENLGEAHLATIAAATGGYSMRGGYGSSMGAYAAIRFSKALNLDRVLAISPLFDIKADWDKRWAMDTAAMNSEPMMRPQHIRDTTEYFVVADPKSQDALHLRRFEEILPRMHLLATAYSGHPSGYFLNQIGALSAIVQGVFVDGRYPAMRRYKANKRRSPVYLFWLAKACAEKRKLRAAEAITLEALALDPANGEYHMHLAAILAARNAVLPAIDACERAIRLNPDKPHFRNYLEVLRNMNVTKHAGR